MVHNGQEKQPKLLRFSEVQSRVGRGRSWLYHAIKAGAFPQPLRRGHCGRAGLLFVSSEVEAWIAARIAERDGQADVERLLFTEKEMAAALKVSVSFLQKDRIGEQRIPFIKLDTNVRYDLDAARDALKALQQGGAR